MRIEEAQVVADWVRDLALPAGSVCLNIGSSTEAFRRSMQPHVGLLFDQLQEAGLRIVHCDMKRADGVDEVGDVLDPAFQDRLRRYDADLLICSNLLEHLVDPAPFAEACASLVKPGGWALVTVPYSYPYHADPIDTMFRPSPEELVRLFRGWEIERGQILDCGHFRPGRQALINHLGRVAMPFYRRDRWWPMAHRLLWLFRRYRQTVLLARKPA
ncbi:hypothetical protein G7077_10510 [Sphingomonas piscis]|uniref:Methyltransferase type 11 n=1 Tax=Sphingomonas piscis TaxID=2714943 RepID=A0A6G7YRA2_9SPHN|nr:methyltransferase domain-containing protein [Sphingomonas piscis]QIK79266.1 hypothetical protein G7077_10510 [Sphingomonas piscis]